MTKGKNVCTVFMCDSLWHSACIYLGSVSYVQIGIMLNINFTRSILPYAQVIDHRLGKVCLRELDYGALVDLNPNTGS